MFCKIAKMYYKFWFRVSRNCENFRYFRYFSLCIISFSIQTIPFRFKAKQAKLTLFFRYFASLIFASFSPPSEMWGHPSSWQKGLVKKVGQWLFYWLTQVERGSNSFILYEKFLYSSISQTNMAAWYWKQTGRCACQYSSCLLNKTKNFLLFLFIENDNVQSINVEK